VAVRTKTVLKGCSVPTKPEGVYQDSRGGWYFKVSLGTDPLTGRREQITRRGFATASAAGRARREVLGRKTRFDYRSHADTYVRPWLGTRRVRDVTPEVVLTWQRKLTTGGGTKKGKPLSPNTIGLARAPLAGAFKLAVGSWRCRP
jgi:hypothetical protein